MHARRHYHPRRLGQTQSDQQKGREKRRGIGKRGEGQVVDLTDSRRVQIQTRSTEQFLSWFIPILPQSSSGDMFTVKF